MEALRKRYGRRDGDLRQAVFLRSSFLVAAGLGVLALGLHFAGIVMISPVQTLGIALAIGLDVAAIVLLRSGRPGRARAAAIVGLTVMLVAILLDSRRSPAGQIYQYVSAFLFILVAGGFWASRWWHIGVLLVIESVTVVGMSLRRADLSVSDLVVAVAILVAGGSLVALLVDRSRRDHDALVRLSDGLIETNNALRNMAYLDSLTGLRNRVAFSQDLRPGEQAVAIVNVGDMTRLATIFELPQIEEILLTLSHRIASLATQLTGFLDVYRTGDHEFTILAQLHDGDRMEFEEKIDVILESLRQPLVVEGQPVYLQSTAGYATVSAEEEPELAVRKAALALYEARRTGNWLQYYSETLERGNARERLVADALISAIARRELHMAYQPIVDHREEVVAFEALLRWNSEELGTISPAEFVPIATRAGLISRLSIRALDLVMNDIRRWPESWPRPDDIHFNVSVSDLLNPGVRDTIAKSLFEFDVPIKVTFELTETEFAINVEQVEHAIRVLKAMGYGFALDDFGAGYSSLSYLSRLPLRTLKIDRSFVSRIPGDRLDETIVDTIVKIADQFEMNVVAEGVETREQYEWLLALGCQFFQGFYFGRPIPLPRYQQDAVLG